MSYPIDGTGSLHIGTCPCAKCNPEPFYCCDGCDGHMPGEPECPPLDNYDARGIDTAYDEALYRL